MTDLTILQQAASSLMLGLAALFALTALRPNDTRPGRSFFAWMASSCVAFGAFYALAVVAS